MVVPSHEIVEVPVEVPIAVDTRLTQKGELAAPDLNEYMGMSNKDKLIHITALYHWNTTRAVQCHNSLDEISRLGEPHDD